MVLIQNEPRKSKYLAYESVMFAKSHNIPILVDIRDSWPDILLSHVPQTMRWLAKTMLYKDFHMIKKTMQMADGLVAVTSTFLKWGLKYAGRERRWTDRLFYLGSKGVPVNGCLQSLEVSSPIYHKLRDKFIVFFVGTNSSSYHNPSVLLEASKRLSKYKDIHFVITGDGELLGKLKKESVNYDNVTLTGWLNQNEISFFLKHSKIGVCPAGKLADFPTNKAFTYLSAGLPIVSAFQGAGSDCIKKLYDCPALYKQMSENARKVFNEMFNADKIYRDYAEHVEMVVQNHRRTR